MEVHVAVPTTGGFGPVPREILSSGSFTGLSAGPDAIRPAMRPVTPLLAAAGKSGEELVFSRLDPAAPDVEKELSIRLLGASNLTDNDSQPYVLFHPGKLNMLYGRGWASPQWKPLSKFAPGFCLVGCPTPRRGC